MREIDLDRFWLVVDYLEGFDERVLSVGELALIYSVLPEVLLALMAAEGVMLTTRER